MTHRILVHPVNSCHLDLFQTGSESCEFLTTFTAGFKRNTVLPASAWSGQMNRQMNRRTFSLKFLCLSDDVVVAK